MTTLPGATRLQMAEEINPADEDASRTLRVRDQLLLGRRTLRERFGNSQPRLLKAGELLGSANGANDNIYHLRNGWACQFRDWFDGRRAIVDVYLPGDVMGIGAHLRLRPLEEVLALTSVMVEKIPAELALTEMMADRAIGLYLAWLLGEHQRRAKRLLAVVSGLDARGRLAMMLLDFYRRLQRRRLITGPTYNLPLTQLQIGQYLGLTVVHINRVLRSLRADRIVSLEKHWVTILDLEQLTNLTHYGKKKCDLVGKGWESPSDRPAKRPNTGDLIGRARDRLPSIQAPHGDEVLGPPARPA